jgi:hypothetical protein
MDLEKDRLIGTRIALKSVSGKLMFTYDVKVKLDTKEKIEAFREGIKDVEFNEFMCRLWSADPQKPLYYCEPGPTPVGYRGKQLRGCLLYAEEIMTAVA